MAFFFLEPVVIPNSTVFTFTQAATFAAFPDAGDPASATGRQTEIRDLLGVSYTHEGGDGSTTYQANATGFGSTVIHGTTTTTDAGPIDFPASSTMGTTSSRTADWGSLETTTTASSTRTVYTTATTSVTRRSGGSSTTASAVTATTTEQSFEAEDFTTVPALSTYVEMFSTSTSTAFGINPVSFRVRAYAEPGEVLYVYTGAIAAGTLWAGGPGWLTTTSALIEGPARVAMDGTAAGPNLGSFSYLLPDLTFSLTYHVTQATGTATVTLGVFDASSTTTSTRTAVATELATTGGGAAANTTVVVTGDPAAVGTMRTTLTGWSTLTDFVTETMGSGGPARTCVTTATTTYTAPTLSANSNTVGSGITSASDTGANYSTIIEAGRTQSEWTARELTCWAGTTAANPCGPAARLVPVPQGGWQVVGAHGPNADIHEAPVSSVTAPEFAMMGGVLVATETSASVTGVRTVERTIEARSSRWGVPVLLHQEGFRTAKTETALLPYGACFVAPMSTTALTATTFQNRVSSAGAGAGSLYQTFPWLEYGTIETDDFPVLAVPNDVNERVVVGPAFQNVPT